LHESLIAITQHWHDFGLDVLCPVAFNEDETKHYFQEMENIKLIGDLKRTFQEEGILPVDGGVHPSDFEMFQKVNASWKQAYLSEADHPDDSARLERLWPWADWPERAV
jgi:hypothetical protein